MVTATLAFPPATDAAPRMRIRNRAVTEALARGEPLKLDLGGGRRPRAGYFSVDRLDCASTDIVADLAQPLCDLPDGCAGAIYSRHALEHVPDLVAVMREIHRLCRPDATIEILVPHFSNVYGYSDPTHVRLFGIHSMHYFCAPERQPPHRQVPNYLDGFEVKLIQLCFYRQTWWDRVVYRLLSRPVNRSLARQEWYERRLAHWIHAWQIRFLLGIVPEEGR